MKFLILNGFHAEKNSYRIMEQFKQLLFDIIQQLKEVGDIQFEYIFVDRHSVQDYLFEPETSLVKPENGLKFDALDMIFIAAPANIRPWHHSMRNVITLIRMCIRTKKLLFLTSFGAQALAFLCASNIQNYINITNGCGEGCKLVDFPKYTNQALKNGNDDFFLDSTTGDLYFYSRQTDEWIPKTNVGIHNRRDAMEYQSIGKFVVKSPTYKPKQQMLSNQTEMTCIIKKQYLQYWLFRDVTMEFQIKQSNQWDIHNINFINPDKKFIVLAENNFRGPLILQCDNILALLFEIESKSKDIVNIISNFIEQGLKTIRYSNNYNQISITFEKYFNAHRGLSSIEIVYDQHRKHKTEESAKTSLHKPGLEYRKHVNAAIQEIENAKPNIQPGFSQKKNKILPEVIHNNIAQKNYKVKRRKSFQQKQEQLMQISKQLQNHEFLQQNPNLDNLLDNQPLTSRRHIKTKTDLRLDWPQRLIDDYDQETPKSTLNQVQVRRLLHPTLDEQFLGIKKIWVPGFLKFKYFEASQTLTQRSQTKMITTRT